MSDGLAHGVGVARAEHFETVAQQRQAATLGIWAWLITELLLFSALFLWLTDKTLEWVLYSLILGWR